MTFFNGGLYVRIYSFHHGGIVAGAIYTNKFDEAASGGLESGMGQVSLEGWGGRDWSEAPGNSKAFVETEDDAGFASASGAAPTGLAGRGGD